MVDTLALALAGLTALAGLWLWGWQRFVPRPPERWVKPQFPEQPPGPLAFFGLVLFFVATTVVAVALRPLWPPGELPREESLRLSFVAILVSGPLIVAGVLAAAQAQRLPWPALGLRNEGLRSAAVEGFRAWW